MERAIVRVNGVVQSVGFRPFVYRMATDLGLRGTVRNRGDAGVLIELEGDAESVDAFLDRLRTDPPPLARVETVDVEREAIADPAFGQFEILESTGGDGGGGTIPPDTATCANCLADVRDPDSRYHDYWATACVDCGPRFTVIEGLPYDRPRTSMAPFPLCDDCRAEYEDPTDRRYHAQTIACPTCGPSLRFATGSGDVTDAATAGTPDAGDETEDETGGVGAVETTTGVQMGGSRDRAADRPESGRDPFPDAPADVADGRDAVREAAAALADGEVVVIKGIGGAHLACDATNPDAVAALRERTGRPEQPFALMAPELDAVESVARLGDSEREALAAPRRPILLVDRRADADVVDAVAPGLHTVGVMLPYAGLHHLLFDDVGGPLVVTSANMPGQPMLVHNAAIAAGLGDVADGFLLHDRRIVARCDDSVARVVDGDRRLVRRSRGFVPTPVPVPGVGDAGVLGLGPELDVTAGVLADGDCYLTQYVGDVDDVATFDYLREAVDHLLSVTGLDFPPVVAHDEHPEFHTTELARRLERERRAERVPVQHHHAHAASVLAEHDRDAAVAITVDGVGYGPDGTVWGGEVLDATRADYERVAGLAPMAMPGGDRATRYPARMLAGALYSHHGDVTPVRELLDRRAATMPGGDEERDAVCQQLDGDVNVARTTSAGRFLDAASALLGCCDERTYEGEPAMKLEALAAGGDQRDVERPRATVGGRPVLDAPAVLARLVELRDEGVSRADVAATAQVTLARELADLAVDTAADRGRDAVVISGGVAYNDHVASVVRKRVTDAGLTFLGNERVPAGDGGIAYGQVAVAAAQTDSG
jgi:hydrogenase maturation protein HypF